MATAYQWNGFVGLDAISQEVGISRSTISKRMSKGMSLEEAVSFKPIDRRNLDITYDGLVGIRAISKAFGIHEATLGERITRRGMSVEQALAASGITCRVEENAEGKRESRNRALWALALGRGQIQ